jgi:hypothetical protein
MRAPGLWVAIAVAGTVGGGLLFACGLDSGGAYVGSDASIDQVTRDAPPPDNYVAPDVADTGPVGTDSGDAGFEAGCNQESCNGTCCGDTCTPGRYSCFGCTGLPNFCTIANGPAGYCVSDCSAQCGGQIWPFDGGCYPNCESLGAFECNGGCVASCDQCGDGGQFGCTSCSDGGLPVIALCQPNATDCPDVTFQSGGLCFCASGDAGQCYGASQVCEPIGGGFPPGTNACLTCGQNGVGGPDTNNQTCKNGATCNRAAGACQ